MRTRHLHLRGWIIVGFALTAILVACGLFLKLKTTSTEATGMSGTKPASVSITAVSLDSVSPGPRSAGWNAGDRVTIKGSGFTPLHNRIFGTDGQVDTLILEAGSKNGTEIVFVLPEGFRAPFGVAIKVVNENGSATTLSAGTRVNF